MSRSHSRRNKSKSSPKPKQSDKHEILCNKTDCEELIKEIDKNANLTKQLKDAQKEKKELRATVETLKKQVKSLEHNNRELEDNIARLQQSVEKISDEKTELSKEIKHIQETAEQQAKEFNEVYNQSCSEKEELSKKLEEKSEENLLLQQEFETLKNMRHRNILVFGKGTIIPSRIQATIRIVDARLQDEMIDLAQFDQIFAVKTFVQFGDLSRLKKRLGSSLQIIENTADLIETLDSMEG